MHTKLQNRQRFDTKAIREKYRYLMQQLFLPLLSKQAFRIRLTKENPLNSSFLEWSGAELEVMMKKVSQEEEFRGVFERRFTAEEENYIRTCFKNYSDSTER